MSTGITEADVRRIVQEELAAAVPALIEAALKRHLDHLSRTRL
jgi:hypothetical protein